PVEHLCEALLDRLDRAPHLVVLLRDDRLDLGHGLAHARARLLHLPLKFALIFRLPGARARFLLAHPNNPLEPSRLRFSSRLKFSCGLITTQTRRVRRSNLQRRLKNYVTSKTNL